MSLLPKSPLRGFSDAVGVLIFLVLVLIVALAYLLSRWVAVHFNGPRFESFLYGFPRAADGVNFLAAGLLMYFNWE